MCSPAMQSHIIKYGELSIDIKEGALGDGLGARVWVVAHTLCRLEPRPHVTYMETVSTTSCHDLAC